MHLRLAFLCDLARIKKRLTDDDDADDDDDDDDDDAVACRGGAGVRRPGHPAWGHPMRLFSNKGVRKCLCKCLKIREKKATAPGIQDKGGIRKK